jgi:mono/diheme cytochrome c family protein
MSRPGSSAVRKLHIFSNRPVSAAFFDLQQSKEISMRVAATLLLPLLAFINTVACAPTALKGDLVERGRSLVKISDCNDCHTEEFMERGGNVPEQEWLKGSRRGWHNDTGTKYATNLRLLASQISERKWITLTRSMFDKSPMVSAAHQEITDSDLAAVYHYLRWLGAAGEPAPQPLPPGVTPPEPFIYFPNAH